MMGRWSLLIAIFVPYSELLRRVSFASVIAGELEQLLDTLVGEASFRIPNLDKTILSDKTLPR